MENVGSIYTPSKQSGAVRFRLLVYLLLTTKKQHPVFTPHRAECLIGALRWIATEERVRLLKVATRVDQLHLLVSLLPHQNTDEVVRKFRYRAEEALFARFPTLTDEVSGSIFEAGYEVDTTGEKSPLSSDDLDLSLDVSLTGLWLSEAQEEPFHEELSGPWETARLPVPPKSSRSDQSSSSPPAAKEADAPEVDSSATVKLSTLPFPGTSDGAPFGEDPAATVKLSIPPSSPASEHNPKEDPAATVKLSVPAEQTAKEANPFDSDPALPAISEENPFASEPSLPVIVENAADTPSSKSKEEAPSAPKEESDKPLFEEEPKRELSASKQWHPETVKLRSTPQGKRNQDYGETVKLRQLNRYVPKKKTNWLLRAGVPALALAILVLGAFFLWPEEIARLTSFSSQSSPQVAHSTLKEPEGDSPPTPDADKANTEEAPEPEKQAKDENATEEPEEINKAAYGKKLAAQKAFPEAARVLEEALKENPEDHSLYRFLGDVYLALGRKDDAVAAWREFVRLAPNGKEKRRVASLIKTYE